MLINNKAEIPLLKIAQYYVTMTKGGKEWIGLCPFPDHQDTKPSFSVNEEKNVWFCHGCSAGGDAVKLIQRIHGVDFQGACSILEKVHGVVFTHQVHTDKRPYLEVMEWAVLQFHQALQSPPEDDQYDPMTYLQKRGLDDLGIMNRWKLGYAPADHYWLANKANEDGINLSIAEQLGLIRGTRDVFMGRIIIPITDTHGEYIGLVGRIINDKIRPKYLNSSHSLLFNKSHTLLNFYRANKAMSATKTFFLVEGPLDAIRMDSIGFPAVVGSLGTALTEEQIALLARNKPKRVVVVGDSDEAGIKASLSRGAALLQHNLPTFAMALPKGEDPDSYGLAHEEEFTKTEILSYTDYTFTITQPKDTEEKIEVVQFLRGIFHGIPDQIRRELLLRELQEKVGIPIDDVASSPATLLPPQEELTTIERDICWALLHHYNHPVMAEFLVLYSPDELRACLSPLGFCLFSWIYTTLVSGKEVNVEKAPEELTTIVASLLEEKERKVNYERFLVATVKFLTLQKWQRQLAAELTTINNSGIESQQLHTITKNLKEASHGLYHPKS